jgi:hypothetical protein
MRGDSFPTDSLSWVIHQEVDFAEILLSDATPNNLAIVEKLVRHR